MELFFIFGTAVWTPEAQPTTQSVWVCELSAETEGGVNVGGQGEGTEFWKGA